MHRVGAVRHRVDVSYDVHWLPPERVAEQLAAAGLDVHATLVREPEGVEVGPQAFLLATRPDESAAR